MPHVRSGDVDIHYSIAGDGVPVLLIMGLATDSQMWMLQVPVLSARYKTITFDNRGVGFSSAPTGPCTMEEMAADALAVLDAAGAGQAHIIGVSMGGAIAQHLALKAPERVRSLVLCATWARRNPYTKRLEELGTTVANTLGREALIRSSLLWLFSPKTFIENPAFIDMVEMMAMQVQAPIDAFHSQTAAVREHDTLERLGEIAAPTLVVAGRRDIMVPPELSEEIANAIPDSKLVMMEGAHAFTVENVDVFNTTLLEWLEAH